MPLNSFTRSQPWEGFSSPRQLTGFQLFKQTMSAVAGQCLNAVALVRLDRESNVKSVFTEQVRLTLHGHLPLQVSFAHVHVQTQWFERIQFCFALFSKIAGKSGHGPEILRIHGRDMERAQAAVRGSSDVEFPSFNFVFTQHLIEKVRKDPITASLKEQIVARRCRTEDHVASLFGLAPIPLEHSIDAIECLSAAGKCKDGGIRPGRVIIVRQNNLVSNGNSAKSAGFAQRLGMSLKSKSQNKKENC